MYANVNSMVPLMLMPSIDTWTSSSAPSPAGVMHDIVDGLSNIGLRHTLPPTVTASVPARKFRPTMVSVSPPNGLEKRGTTLRTRGGFSVNNCKPTGGFPSRVGHEMLNPVKPLALYALVLKVRVACE